MVCFMELPFIFVKYLKYLGGDFPSGRVVKNLPSNAGNLGLIPGRGTKTSHAAGQLSPHATTTDPLHSRAWTPQ